MSTPFIVHRDKSSIPILEIDSDHPELLEILRESNVRIDPCPSCHDPAKNYVELEPFLISYRYGGDQFPRAVPLADSEKGLEAFNRFLKKHHGGHGSFNITKVVFLRPVHEPNCDQKDIDFTDYITCDKEIYLSNFIKIRQIDKKLCTFLKIDGESIQKFPEMDQPCLDLLRQLAYKKIPKVKTSGYVNTLRKTKKKVGRTNKFKKSQVPEGFALTLRDYQRKNLSWMRAMEDPNSTDVNTITTLFDAVPENSSKFKFRIANLPYEFEYNHPNISLTPISELITEVKSIKLNGGVLLDVPGSGKKVTALALIHSNPAPYQEIIEQDRLVKSRATLVLCSQNTYFQWIDEAKKCNPNFKILNFLEEESKLLSEGGPNDERQFHNNDFKDYDIIFMTYDAFAAQYLKLEDVQFHRIIFDNYNCKKSRKMRIIRNLIKALHIWTLGAGPSMLNHLNQIDGPMIQLRVNEDTGLEFTKKYFKKTKFLNAYNPSKITTVNVKLTQFERKRLFKFKNKTPRNVIIRCGLMINHLKDYWPHNKLKRTDSIDRIESKLADPLRWKIKNINFCLESRKRCLEKMKESVCNEKHETRIKRRQNRVEKLEEKVAKIQRDLNFKLGVIETFKTDRESMKCSICHFSTVRRRISILECGHYFCFDCVCEWMKDNAYCPYCNTSTEMDKAMFPVTDCESDQVSCMDYGSKFMSVYNNVMDELESAPDSRIILYVQFKSMARRLEQMLKNIKLEFVRLTGSALQRHEAVKAFRTSPTIRILLACYQDDILGVHIPEATHLIYYMPFFAKTEKDRKIYKNVAEKRGELMLSYYDSERVTKSIIFESV